MGEDAHKSFTSGPDASKNLPSDLSRLFEILHVDFI
jgi:hypothetical protein